MSSEKLSFAADIRPLFRDIDVAHMKPAGYDLSDYDDVKKNAAVIYDQVAAGTMPPGAPWKSETVATFKSWQDQGCPP